MKTFKDFFSFSKAELNGILVFLLLLLLLITSYYTLPLFISSRQTDFSSFDKDLKTLTASDNYKSTEKQTDIPVQIVFFDPNRLTYNEWIEMGVPAKIAKTIQNYLGKGGHFYKKEDLSKIYGLDEKLYERLGPYIVIKEKDREKLTDNKQLFTGNKTEKFLVDINKAVEADFMKIKGIGKVFSGRIVKYRNLLGGFYAVEQLNEVYGIDSAKFREIRPFLVISEITIDQDKKVDINKAGLSQFKAHPYLSGSIGNNIIKSREGSGSFSNVNELLVRNTITPREFDKVRHYLTIEYKGQ